MRVVVTQYFASAVNATVNWFLLCYNLALIFLSGIKKNFLKKMWLLSLSGWALEGVVPVTS